MVEYLQDRNFSTLPQQRELHIDLNRDSQLFTSIMKEAQREGGQIRTNLSSNLRKWWKNWWCTWNVWDSPVKIIYVWCWRLLPGSDRKKPNKNRPIRGMLWSLQLHHCLFSSFCYLFWFLLVSQAVRQFWTDRSYLPNFGRRCYLTLVAFLPAPSFLIDFLLDDGKSVINLSQ